LFFYSQINLLGLRPTLKAVNFRWSFGMR